MTANRIYQPFDEALLFGQRAEERVRDLLCAAGGFVSKLNNTKQNDFQLIFQNQTHRVELKNEDNYASSGNICIEFWQGCGERRRPSGIAVSEANILIHTLKDNVVLYRRADMQAYLKAQLYARLLVIKSFGDNCNQGVVVRIADIHLYPWCEWIQTHRIGQSKLWFS